MYNLFHKNVWVSNMLKHPKNVKQTSHIYVNNNFIYNLNQLHSKYFYSDYQITNNPD